MLKPPVKVAMALNRLAKKKINRILVTGFLKKPLTVWLSVGIASKSLTKGFFNMASIKAENQPTPTTGVRVVRGAKQKEATIVRGWANNRMQAKAAAPPFHNTQAITWSIPNRGFCRKDRAMIEIMISGSSQPSSLAVLAGGGTSVNPSMDWGWRSRLFRARLLLVQNPVRSAFCAAEYLHGF